MYLNSSGNHTHVVPGTVMHGVNFVISNSFFYRNEEIVMPAERTGWIKENYDWKVGLTKTRFLLKNLLIQCYYRWKPKLN